MRSALSGSSVRCALSRRGRLRQAEDGVSSAEDESSHLAAPTLKFVPPSAFFLIFVVVVMALAGGSLVLRQRRESPMRDWVRKQPVLFEARAAILIHARGMEGVGWAILKGAGWPRLVVHAGGLEASIAGFDGLVSGNTILTEGATMCRDRLGAFPIVGNHDCIRLIGNDGTGVREWRVSPRDRSVDELWAQLATAGVTPST